jgi:hypothetical protein
MNKEEIINRAYDLFSSFKRPLLFTRLNESEDDLEARNHDDSLKNTTRRNLSVSQIGPVGYSPVPSFTSQAMAYFLPRLIEFAVKNVTDSDNSPYIIRFINSTLNGPDNKQFKLLDDQQREIVYHTLLYTKENYYKDIENECWEKDLEIALNKWKK